MAAREYTTILPMRAMRSGGIARHAGCARTRRRFKRTTDSGHAWPVAPNLIAQDFAADGPDRKWGADISYIWTTKGPLYLAFVLDLFSRPSPWASDQARIVHRAEPDGDLKADDVFLQDIMAD